MSNLVAMPPRPTEDTPRNHGDLRKELDIVRIGKVKDPETNKYSRIPEHIVEQQVWKLVKKHFDSRGEFFRAPEPFYFDRVDNRLYHANKGDAEMGRVFSTLGLLGGSKHANMVEKEIAKLAGTAKLREPHHLSYFTGEHVYLNTGRNSMIKVGPDSVEEVPLGTDGVILLGDNVGEWPTVLDLESHFPRIKLVLGDTCTRPIRELPLAKHIAPRFSTAAKQSPDQAHWMFMARFLLIPFGSRYPLWPIQSFVGMEGSGKSTPGELQLTLFAGVRQDATAMPRERRDLYANITSHPLTVWDNIDRAGLDDKHKADMNDLICNMATGAELSLRVLYKTNEQVKYKVRNHLTTSACSNPFPYSDVQRRVLTFEIKPADPETQVDKMLLIQNILDNRTAMLAEYVLRTQNILRAHLVADNKVLPPYMTMMAEYEKFTYICAAYEGSLNETVEMWRAYVANYQEEITEHNALVTALRLWLGQDSTRANQPVSAMTLYQHIRGIYERIDQQLAYTKESSFSRALLSNRKPLQILRMTERRTARGREYVFSPDEQEIARCKKLFEDATTHTDYDPEEAI